MEKLSCDVIVVGAGNAALCAALSAQEQGASVMVLERAPQDKRGGNSAFTGGGFRTVYNGLDDIKTIVPDITEEEIANSDFGQYTLENYLDDLGRITQYHTDPDLAETLASCSTDTIRWLRSKGIRFQLKYGRQAFKHEGRFKFWAGIIIAASGGGRGLVDAQFKAAEKLGIPVRYNAHATELLRGPAGVEGVRVLLDGVEREIRAAIRFHLDGLAEDGAAVPAPSSIIEYIEA